MLFIDNKYTRWYYSIINKAQERNINNKKDANIKLGGSERHHIIPKCLGGTDIKSNLVFLTFQEHFICHRLLPKMTVGENKKKMFYAQNMMLAKTKTQQRAIKITSSVYRQIKEDFSKINPFNDPVWQRENSINAQGRKFTKEHIANIVAAWDNEERKKIAGKRLIARAATRRELGITSPLKGRKFPERTGVNNSFYGKRHSDEFYEMQRQLRKGKPMPFKGKTLTCPHCKKTMDLGNYSRYHGNKCRYKTNDHDPLL